MDDFAGRVAIVTGAASGIGLAIAGALAEAGAAVVMVDINGDALEEAAREMHERTGGLVASRRVDVRDQAAVADAAEFAVQQFGQLHIAVNNAGIVNGGRS